MILDLAVERGIERIINEAKNKSDSLNFWTQSLVYALMEIWIFL